MLKKKWKRSATDKILALTLVPFQSDPNSLTRREKVQVSKSGEPKKPKAKGSVANTAPSHLLLLLLFSACASAFFSLINLVLRRYRKSKIKRNLSSSRRLPSPLLG
jgi:hypothetical protein